MKILLVEDDAALADALCEYLEGEGLALSVAGSVAEAEAAVGDGPDLVILDWMLPDGQGIDLLKRWRGAGNPVPVIFLTARADLIDKVLGLELGADDYVTKPFEPRELLARIKARLRVSPAEVPRSTAGAIELDVSARRAWFSGAELELTRKEFDLLELFLDNPGRVFSRDELLNRVWGYESYPTTRTIDTHLLQLRQKTGPEYFETVRGIGYRFVLPES